MFIKDLSCISPQRTLDNYFFENPVKFYSGNIYSAIEPDYTDLIPGSALRRMGKAARMFMGAGLPLVRKYPNLGGIITGTADGGIEDSMKFLDQIVKYEEGALTPTNFVQSTPNSLGGQLALMSRNTGYNTTYVNKGLAFESALQDSMLLLEEKEVSSLLVGGVDQYSEHNYNIEYLAGSFKTEDSDSLNLLSSKTPGTVCGEGCAVFVVDADHSNALAEIKDVGQISFPQPAELIEKVKEFIHRNNLEIDAVILGMNGDHRTDFWYENILKNVFPTQGIYTCKNLTGEYPTSASFALWLSVQILQGKNIPAPAIRRKPEKPVKNMLIYNHYKGVQHGFILVGL